MERELRFNPAEVRADKAEDGNQTLSGIAVVYNSLSQDLGGFRERILPGALTKVLASPDNIFATTDHNLTVVTTLGSRENQTLSLWDTPEGLAFTVTMPDTTTARDAFTNVSNGNISGMSFAFTCAKDQWSVDESGQRIREVLEFGALYEISIVVNPAYTQSNVTAAMRSLEAWEKTTQKTPDAEILRKRLELLSLGWK
jgi:hypothetical protein